MKSKRAWRWSKESVNKITGKNNPCYRNGESMRSVKKDATGLKLFFKNRNEYKASLIDKNGSLWCERCGSTSSKLEAHHIIYRSEKPRHKHLHSKENIILLCVPCHNWFHKSKSNRNELVLERKLNLLFGDSVLDK
jgi:5-methylcytosine-specific restriction endonuclease McrA